MAKINIDKAGSFDPIRAERQPDVKAGHDAPIRPASGETKVRGDQIKVSEKAAEFSTLVGKVKEMPDVRADRVEDLRAQLAAGSFRPSGDEIADAILKDEKN